MTVQSYNTDPGSSKVISEEAVLEDGVKYIKVIKESTRFVKAEDAKKRGGLSAELESALEALGAE